MRTDQHTRIIALHAEGVSNREISRQVGLSHVTVAKVLKAVTTPPGNPNGALVVTTSPARSWDPHEPQYGPECEPLWPSWEPTGEVRIGKSGTAYAVMRALAPRPARVRDPQMSDA